MNEIENKIKTQNSVISLKESGLMYLGALIFIIGVIFCFSSVIYIVINHLNLSNLEKMYNPLTTIGIGAPLILTGTNVVLKPGKIYVSSVIAPQILLSLLSMIMLWAGYPKSWYYPSIGYLFSFYTIGILLLIGNIFVNVRVKMDSSLEEGKGIEEVFIINEELKPLRYWSQAENVVIGEVLQSDVCNLIVKCEDLKVSLEKVQRDAKSDVKNLLLSSIEVIDTFDALFKKIEPKRSEVDRQTKIWLGNFKSIKRLAERVLADAGVSQIETPSGKAIPGMHRIVGTKEMPGLEEDVIFEEVEKGYLWKGEILRKSSVITVKN